MDPTDRSQPVQVTVESLIPVTATNLASQFYVERLMQVTAEWPND